MGVAEVCLSKIAWPNLWLQQMFSLLQFNKNATFVACVPGLLSATFSVKKVARTIAQSQLVTHKFMSSADVKRRYRPGNTGQRWKIWRRAAVRIRWVWQTWQVLFGCGTKWIWGWSKSKFIRKTKGHYPINRRDNRVSTETAGAPRSQCHCKSTFNLFAKIHKKQPIKKIPGEKL